MVEKKFRRKTWGLAYGPLYSPGLYRLPKGNARQPIPETPPEVEPPPPVDDPVAEEPTPPVPGTRLARNGAEFCAALNDRRVELFMSTADLDEATGLPRGRCAQLLAGTHGNSYSATGPAYLGKLLAALGLEISIVPALTRIEDLPSETYICPQAVKLHERGRKGAAAFLLKTNPRRRLAWARKAAWARWARVPPQVAAE